MILTRTEISELLEVADRYLSPSNFEHVQGGARLKGYNLISMSGKGKNATYEIESLENDLPNEIWKELPIAPGYQVSNKGRVKHPKGGILKGYNSKGYIKTRIANLGQMSNHRLVMIAFDPIDNAKDFVVDHINGIKDDNRLENLRWVWQSENMQFCDENNTEMKEIIANLVKKYGYEDTKSKMLALFD